jgi:DNA-binding transcriptional regulator YhcF (GntR family)
MAQSLPFWHASLNAATFYGRLSAYLVLAILSRRLQPGQKLPGIHQLARRLMVRPKTVAAVYRNLARQGWLERGTGSGLYVRSAEATPLVPNPDKLVKAFLTDAHARGLDFQAIRNSFLRLTARVSRWLVFDRDLELARILATELGQSLGRSISFSDGSGHLKSGREVLTVDSSQVHLPETWQPASLQTVPVRSFAESLDGPGQQATRLAVVSRSATVLQWAQSALPLHGHPADRLLLRNPSQPDWQTGLTDCDLIATDVVTAADVPHAPVVVLRFVPPDFAGELVQRKHAL